MVVRRHDGEVAADERPDRVGPIDPGVDSGDLDSTFVHAREHPPHSRSRMGSSAFTR